MIFGKPLANENGSPFGNPRSHITGAPGEIAPPLRYCGAPLGPLSMRSVAANRQRPTTLRVVVELPPFWFAGRRESCRLLLNQRVRRPVLTLHSAESRQVTPSADSTLRYRARRVSAFDRSWSRKAAVGCADEELSLAGRQLRSTRGTDFVFPNHLGWVWHDGQAGVCGRCRAARAISDRA